MSSQVGQIGSGLQPRWDRSRRTETTLSLLRDLPMKGMVSHEFDFARAPDAYKLLDEHAADALGVLLRY